MTLSAKLRLSWLLGRLVLFFLSFFVSYILELVHQTVNHKLCHDLGSEPDLQMHVQNVGSAPPPPLQKWRPGQTLSILYGFSATPPLR